MSVLTYRVALLAQRINAVVRQRVTNLQCGFPDDLLRLRITGHCQILTEDRTEVINADVVLINQEQRAWIRVAVRHRSNGMEVAVIHVDGRLQAGVVALALNPHFRSRNDI